MSWSNLARWLLPIRPDRAERDPAQFAVNRLDSLGLFKWFAGLGPASEEERANDASPEAGARVRAAVDRLPVTLFEFDRNGIYTCAAGKYIGLFGVTSSQIVGRSVFEFPRFVPGKNMMVRRALSGETVSFTGIWPLGRYAIRLQPQLGADGRVASVVGMGFGLSKATAADEQLDQVLEALRQSEARFRAMCESAPLGIYVTNSKSQIAYVNPALCSLLGKGAQDLVGRDWKTALDIREPEGRPTNGAGRPEPKAYDAIRLTRRDSSRVWTSLRVAEMRDGGELLGYVGAITDITQERSARLAIDRAQQDLRRVIECSPEGIAVIRDGRFIFVNRALADALGYPSPERLLGQNASEIVHPDDRTRALDLGTEPQSGASVELRYRKANGEHALLEIRPAPLSEFEGAAAVLITARDVTEKKKLQAQLMVTERVLSLGMMAAGVAHEINNPLAVVLGNLEWVAAQLKRLCNEESNALSPAALRAAVQRVVQPIAGAREAAGRVRAIVRDLKLFSRIEEERNERVELTGVLDSAARMAWNEVRHRARFIREYGELPAVQGSEARLGQVFLNLIINAAQAIPEGHADQNEICVRAHVLPTNEVVIEVRDTGCGMAPEVIDRIFDPFFTTKPPGIGTGLGLAICHRIVGSLGGRLEAESQPGRGSTFRVTLAIAESEAPLVAQPARHWAPRDETRGRVMVIDDDRATGNAIGLALREDHDVEILTSARSALARLWAGERYDAIVCDVMMPEMSGVDFHSELTQKRPELANRVIFLTGGAFTLLAREFLDRVPNPRLDKPFDSDSLRAAVNRQISRAT